MPILFNNAGGNSALIGIPVGNSYTATGGETNVSILGGNITKFTKDVDLLLAYEDGLPLLKDEGYVIAINGTSIDLIGHSLTAGQKINFIVLKYVGVSNAYPVVAMLQDHFNSLTAHKPLFDAGVVAAQNIVNTEATARQEADEALGTQIESVSTAKADKADLIADKIKLSANTTTFFGIPANTTVDQVLCMIRPTVMPTNAMFKVFSKDNKGNIIPNTSLDVYKGGAKVATIVTDATGQAIFVGAVGAYTFTDPRQWQGFSSQSASATATTSGDVITIPYIYTQSTSAGSVGITSSGTYYFSPHITRVDLFICGGGAGGASGACYGGGGGGGGGYTTVATNVPVSGYSQYVSVGSGGSGGSDSTYQSGSPGSSGGYSSFAGYSASGGFGGLPNGLSGGAGTGDGKGGNGGSGGGGGDDQSNSSYTGGGGGTNGGGGGRGGKLSSSTWTQGGSGQGASTLFNGNYYGAGGGGGGGGNNSGGGGGATGGGAGANTAYGPGQSATFYGGGGGGGAYAGDRWTTGTSGGSGHSGYINVSWKAV